MQKYLQIIKCPWVPRALSFIILFLSYQVTYLNYGPVPGNDLRYPLGWWGWFDQGFYLKAAKDLAALRFDPSAHFYPPLYPFLGSLFISTTPVHPFYFVDLASMLAYAAFFFALMERYIGIWPTAAALLAGTIGIKVISLQWVIPWTSTPSAAILIAAIYLLNKYIRFWNDPLFCRKDRFINAFLFGFLLSLLLPNRPGDCAAALPMVLVYGSFLTIRIFGEKTTRNTAIGEIFSGISGAIPPIAGFFLFNFFVEGSIFGSYFGHVSSNGFFIADLPEKFYSQLVNSYPFYGEHGADWLSTTPLLLFSLIFLIPAIFAGPLIFRTIAVTAWLTLSIAYAYSDIIPTGTFRFFNIHYFKWMFPLAIGVMIYFVLGAFSRDVRRRKVAQRALVVVMALVLFIFSITTVEDRQKITAIEQNGSHVLIDLPQTRTDFLRLPGVSGGWWSIYGAQDYSAMVNGQALRFPRDYHLFPSRSGIRMLFVRPVHGGKLILDFGSKLHLQGDLKGRAESVAVRFHLDFPWRARQAPKS